MSVGPRFYEYLDFGRGPATLPVSRCPSVFGAWVWIDRRRPKTVGPPPLRALSILVYSASQYALSTFPANDAAVEEWLIDIKQIYDRTAERSGLGDILQDTKQQVADADAANFSTRMTAARSRRGAPSVFQGHPHSTERVAQFERMQAEERSRARRGILTSTMPRPHNLQDTSTALYRRWFLNRAAGIEMQQSARATGRNPMAGLDDEGREEYLRRRVCKIVRWTLQKRETINSVIKEWNRQKQDQERTT
ncbi:hypothetical protein BJV82DRAFT_669346 [Fennellomyces sp. T-0311]|nr:hypothetical protein BJV82DRAFT_669346 [Fennellomyces sp. T-0311]